MLAGGAVGALCKCYTAGPGTSSWAAVEKQLPTDSSTQPLATPLCCVSDATDKQGHEILVLLLWVYFTIQYI